MSATIYWHDYETFGVNPATDWPSQFAGIRTDPDLNEVADEEPLMLFCAPPDDQLPSPEACLVTGITPQKAMMNGVCEARFIDKIHQDFMVPGTCVAGYNSLRFDDEVTRNSLYRNFFDPYGREWKNGNSRWDLIDLVRLTHALRPEGIVWPKRDDGAPGFRLELLTEANGISHEAAHDALSDVRATIALARLIKNVQPKLYEFSFQHRQKHALTKYLDPMQKRPLIHVSGRYAAARNSMALILPIAPHPDNSNGVIVVDLMTDPQMLFDLSEEELSRLLYTPTSELAADEVRPGIKTVHINKCPMVAPLSVLREQDVERLQLDMEKMKQNYESLLAMPELREKMQRVMASRSLEAKTDPDHMIYSGGFFSKDDRSRMDAIRSTAVDQLNELEPDFDDSRLSEMLFRYKARNYPEIINDDERNRWQQFRHRRLHENDGGGGRTLENFYKDIERLLVERNDVDSQKILMELKQWGDCLQQSISIN